MKRDSINSTKNATFRNDGKNNETQVMHNMHEDEKNVNVCNGTLRKKQHDERS